MPFDDPGGSSTADTPYVAKLLRARELVAAGWVQNIAARVLADPADLTKDDSADDFDNGQDVHDYKLKTGVQPYRIEFCALGALQYAWNRDNPGDGEKIDPVLLLLGFINNAADPVYDPFREDEADVDADIVYRTVFDWNDDLEPEGGLSKVLAVFDKAIAKARELGV
jgi:hypothetical protein